LQPDHIHKKRILISPLNWGLGHVMRLVPLIRQFQFQGNTILIACDAEQQRILEHELHQVTYIPFEGYPFAFTGKSFRLDLARKFSNLSRFVAAETSQVNALVKAHAIDVVISDQRPGFRSDTVPSVLISHQLELPLPVYLKPAQWIYSRWVNRFDTIWIPDKEGAERLSGKLSQTTHPQAFYIGWLSRFEKSDTEKLITYRYGALISGPEPYRTQFMEEVKTCLLKLDEPCFLIGPVEKIEQLGKLTLLPHQSTAEFQNLMESAEYLIARAGYSTLMDLRVLGKKGILIPTPGQDEQLYLSQHLKGDAQFTFVREMSAYPLERPNF
jgi:hypothetical protein